MRIVSLAKQVCIYRELDFVATSTDFFVLLANIMVVASVLPCNFFGDWNFFAV